MVLKSANPFECVRSIFSLKNLQSSWRYSEKIDSGSLTNLHPWNNFKLIEKHPKESLRRSPRKKVKEADCSEQQDHVQQDLFETDDNIKLDDSSVDFVKTTKGLTDNAYNT